MTLFRTIHGSAHDIPLPDGSVQTIVTSPPYWGLRKYSGDQGVEWPAVTYAPMPGLPPVTVAAMTCDLGLEPTVEAYIGHLMLCLREWHRVLRDDGVAFVNLGDSFQDKQLQGVPWKFAMAAQASWEEPYVIAKERDRAWLAALIDGEGCISIGRNKARTNGAGNGFCNDNYHAFVCIGNNDRELLDHCVAITGYGSVRVKDRPFRDSRGIQSRRTYYGWRLDSEKAITIIREVYPFLIAKRRQAILAHNLDLSNKAGRELRGNGTLPESEQEKRQFLKEMINKCNQREPVDLPAWCEEPKREVHPGWWLRSDIIGAKVAPMPESVTDRPTRAHEYIFLLTKSARYYYDADAVRENLQPSTIARYQYGWNGVSDDGSGGARTGSAFQKMKNGATMGEAMGSAGRNLRSVWEWRPQGFRGAHFAVWPEAIPERCIRAGSSERGACPHCGAPWRRITEKGLTAHDGDTNSQYANGTTANRLALLRQAARERGGEYTNGKQTVGWQPSCTCEAADPVPCVVMDPFGGSNTTGVVALKLGRAYVGVDISQEYLTGVTAERIGGGVQIGLGV